MIINTVTGPVDADALGPIAVHEALLSVLPGAQYAPDIDMDRSRIFAELAPKLRAFAAAGGGAIVDSTGMFAGRDLLLLEALSRATGVKIVASTGQGPEELLGGYFLTPQTNPPTPWPADKFAALFAAEVSEGMVVPRVERRAAAGLITTTATESGMTATDESLLRGVARAARATGVAASIRFGRDPLAELAVVLDEGIDPGRVLLGGLDRPGFADAALAVAAQGVFVGIDHCGQGPDADRIALVTRLIEAGHADRVILSSNATGAARGVEAVDVPFEYVLTTLAPKLRAAGVPDETITQIVHDNPRTLLGVQGKEN